MKTSKRTGGAPVRYVLSFAIAGAFLAPNARALTTDLAGAPTDPAQAAPAHKYSPGVQEIQKMIQAKVDVEIIKTYVKNSPTAYALTADEIIDLQKQGVPDEVVTAMIQHGAELRARPAQPAPPPTGAPAPQYAPGPAPYSAPAPPTYTDNYSSPAPYYDFSTPDYSYAGYPWSYSYGYPYYSYPYYNYWWSSYGYPWFGFYPYYGYGYYGYNRYHHGYPWYHGYGRYGDGHRGDGHSGGYGGHNPPYHNNGPYRGYGAPNRNQPWQPVGTYASRSAYRAPYTSARNYRGQLGGNYVTRPMGSFASRPSSFAPRSMGSFAARPSGGFASRPTGFASAGFRGAGGGARMGGGGGGHAGGGRR